MKKNIFIFGLLLVLLVGLVSANVYDNFESYDAGNIRYQTSNLWDCADNSVSIEDNCKVVEGDLYFGDNYGSVVSGGSGNPLTMATGRDVVPVGVSGVIRFRSYLSGSCLSGGLTQYCDSSMLLVTNNYNLNKSVDDVDNVGEVFGGFRLNLRAFYSSYTYDGLDVFDVDSDSWTSFVANNTIGLGTTLNQSYNGSNIIFDGYFEVFLDLDSELVTYILRAEDGSIVGQMNPISTNTLSTDDVYDVVFDAEINSFGGGTGASTKFDNVEYIYGNSIPVVSDVTISPSNPDVLDNLVCSYSFSDGDGDSDNSVISWYVNGLFMTHNLALGSGSFLLDDVVSCSVQANDGFEDGNVDSQTLIVGQGIVGGGVTEVGLTLSDEYDLGDIVITDIDVNEGATMMVYVGSDSSNGENLVGVVEVSPDNFGVDRQLVIGVGGVNEPVSVDMLQGIIWVGGYNFVERISYIYSADSLLLSDNQTFKLTTHDAVYREVVASPLVDENGFYDTIVFACRHDLSGSENFDGVEVLMLNTSNNQMYSKFKVPTSDCRGLDIDDGYLFVDDGSSGVSIFYIEPTTHNLTQKSNFNSRSSFVDLGSQWGRSDFSNVFNDYLFTINASPNVAEKLLLVDVSNKSNPVNVGYPCSLDTSNSDVVNLEPLNESFVLLTDDSNSNIYGCDLLSDEPLVLLWDNPDVPESYSQGYGYKLVHYTDGGNDFFYTHDVYGLLRIFQYIPTSVVVGDNTMPFFSSITPDSQYIDNLNPISTNTTPSGLETPVVNVFALNCKSPNLYDCAIDSEGDNILFAVVPDYQGSLTYPEWWSYEGYSTTYDNAGLYTMRVYITDVEHPNDYSVFKDFTINVSGVSVALPENYSTLKFKVVDSITGYDISGAYVDISGGIDNGYTDVNGLYSVIGLEGVYSATFSKSGYLTQTHSYSTSTIVQNVQLDPMGEANRRTLVLTTKDSDNNLLSGVFIQIQMPVTHDFEFGYTDVNGRVVFYPNEDDVLVDIDDETYGIARVEISVPFGSVVTKDIILTGSGILVQGAFDLTGCQDYIQGILLCDYDEVLCNIDSDCPLTDSCGYTGHCSNFNWSLCDEQGIARGNRCFLKNTGGGLLSSVGDIIIDNFFYVLIVVLVLIGLLILSLRRGK